ncbi:hypothetical protein C8R43DRAFT_1142516 [Mycena crocata]|nr:hypothetical protein C8R43DRAFT_1142516 [Mycena crocata]
MIPIQEIRRLFGPVNRPHYKTNLRHQAILRKALELFSIEELAAIFERLTGLRVVIGSASTINVLGRIQTHHVRNDTLVCREMPAPDAAARQALLAYRQAYDGYFMKQGMVYRVRDPQALPALQAAEQAWHDWIVPYLAARGRPGRPEWALQPLPGLQRVRIAAEPAPQVPNTPVRGRGAALPSPPLTSPVRRARPTQSPSLSQSHRTQLNLLTPPPTSPLRSTTTHRSPKLIPDTSGPGASRSQPIDLACGVTTNKRKFLGLIDISDVVDSDDDDAEVELRRPRKKQKLSGVDSDDSDDEVEIVSEVIDLTI